MSEKVTYNLNGFMGHCMTCRVPIRSINGAYHLEDDEIMSLEWGDAPRGYEGQVIWMTAHKKDCEVIRDKEAPTSTL